MSWERDFEGIPLEGKHTIYSFLFMLNNNIDKKNYTYETMCDKELTAKRRYARYLKKLSTLFFASFCYCYLLYVSDVVSVTE